eukprot:TRINITY_DN2173_c0_g1_i2.p1 TRINITY_DN2173_c0_g1~~TRINITY_DN2173_c0_g1_i2.p1  ORF type:complete len:768 (+),score=148.79 TRINITY_DN2173_c0_g1_i2:520-2823(+)
MMQQPQLHQNREYHKALPMRQSSMSSTNISGDYGSRGDGFSAKRLRRVAHRRTVDYSNSVVRYLQVRMWQRDARDSTVLQPTRVAAVDMLPPVAYPDNPSTSFASKFVQVSTNKNRCSINRVLWTPTGRRLITGSQSGEFTLWNGLSFNFEMILQAHDHPIRSMIWSHNENWMVTGDDGGSIKYWQTNMNNVKANQNAHKEAVRDLSFSRTDLKFCSCSDDTTVKVWDFARCQEERSLTGHGWDVKSVDWHPTKSLLVSGGKDNVIKLWDAKTGTELCSLHGHKNTVLCVKWNQNGNWVLTASKDQIIKLYDIRTLKEVESYRGHQKDVTALAWHPFHEELFVSGSYDGAIFHWLVGHESPQAEIQNAHDSGVWDLAWHPMGHILCSGSNDHTTRFWCRNRPGDTMRDKSFVQGSSDQNAFMNSSSSSFQTEGLTIPGPFASGTVRSEGTIPGVGVAMPLSVPTLDTNPLADPLQQSVLGTIPGIHPTGSLPSYPSHPSVPTNQQPYQQAQQVQAQQQQQQVQQPHPHAPPFPIQPPPLQQQQLQLQQTGQPMQGPHPMPLAMHPHQPPPPPPPAPRPPLPPLQMGGPSSMPSAAGSSESMLPRSGSSLPSVPMLNTSQYSTIASLQGQLTQGSPNQIHPLSQNPSLGPSSLHHGQVNVLNIPGSVGGFMSGMTNVLETQGTGAPSYPTNAAGLQPQPSAAGASGLYNRPQGGPLPPVTMQPGLNTFQPNASQNPLDGRASGPNMGSNVGHGIGMGMGLPSHHHGTS